MVHLGSSLLLPVVTRWNSLFDAVQRLLCHQEKLNDLCDKLALPHFFPGDLQYLNMYKLLMEPNSTALDFFQGEKNMNSDTFNFLKFLFICCVSFEYKFMFIALTQDS